MVRKLFKHEFHVWFRVLWLVSALVLLLSGANRILQFFESDSVLYYLIFSFSLFFVFVTMAVALTVPNFYGVIRFYKHLFSGEGYLSFTLPVTPAQHLWVKSVTATVMTLAVGVVCVLGCMLLMAGDVFTEVWKLIVYLGGKADQEVIWNLVGLLAELLAILVVGTFSGHMVFYSCVCLGQLFRKNRILGAFLVYIIYYVVTQVVSMVFSFSLEILAAAGAMDWLNTFTAEHPFLFGHISMGSSLLLNLVIAVACFIICNTVMKRKLNLE